MIIDITKLKQSLLTSIEVNEDVFVSKEELNKVNIIDLKDTKVTGYITKDDTDSYNLDLVLDGILVFPDSVSLNPVDVPFSTEIYGNYAEMMEEIQEIAKKSNNSLDIFPIIWENILMEIPIKVTGPEATDLKLSGDGWKLVTEESEEKENSAFAKLKDLL